MQILQTIEILNILELIHMCKFIPTIYLQNVYWYIVLFLSQFLEVQSKIHPLGRVALPLDCARAVAFLASDLASFTTGQILYVDGGRNCVSPGVQTNVTK